jgi:nucleoside-diphosphate kinase
MSKGVSKIGSESQIGIVLLKPEGMKHEHELVTEILKVFEQNDIFLTYEGHCIFTYMQAYDFYAGHKGRWYRSKMANQLAGKILHGFVFEGEDAIQKLRDWVGSTDPEKAKAKEPNSPRARFGKGNMAELAIIHEVVDNAVHVTGSMKDAAREIDCFGLAVK